MLRTKLIVIAAAAVAVLQLMGVGYTVFTIYGAEFDRLAEARERNLLTAANVLDLRFPELAVTYGEGDTVERMNVPAVGEFSEHEAMRQIGAVTGATATLFGLDPATGDFLRRTTNIIAPDGTRAVGTPLGLDNPVHAVVSGGGTYRGEATILGKDYLAVYQPIFDMADENVIGVLYVGTDKDVLAAAVRADVTALIIQASVIVLLTMGLLWLLLSRALAGLGRLQVATDALASGSRDLTVPEQGRRDELGLIARGLEALRANLVAAETAHVAAEAEEAAARDNLARMLTELDREVSSVVNAVGNGDLSRGVTSNFDQPELQSLADAVNALRDRVQGFVGDIGGTLRAMAKGDLTCGVPQVYSGDFGTIASDANETLDRLGGVLGEVLTAIEDNQRGVALIDRASIDLGSRVEEQAAALQQTAATMEEMAASVKSNAVSLSEAEAAAQSARATTKAGASAASAAVEAVGRIAESSNQIAEILKVIDSIAFQTNLLALNAAVEAARAGDAGKGFAVVANEVGNLARQSSEAARDISALVTKNQGSVEEGVEMVQGAGAALGQIDDEITRLTQRVTAVSLAGREQSTGIEEVNRAVSGLDQMTQENATLTESTASQVGTLNRDMARLVQIVSALRIRPAASKYGSVAQQPVRSAA